MDTKKGSRYVSVITLFLGWILSASTPVVADEDLGHEIKVPFTIVNGRINVFGYLLQPRAKVEQDEDSPDYVTFDQSPNKRWIVIGWWRYDGGDYWLYDSSTKSAPARIPTEPGRNVGPQWLSDSVFEISWGGMGYSMADVFRADNLKETTHIDDPLMFDLSRGLYVSHYFDKDMKSGVEIGRLFVQNREAERFPVKLDIEYVSNALTSFNDISIKGNSLIVSYTQNDGTVAHETFKPILLSR